MRSRLFVAAICFVLSGSVVWAQATKAKPKPAAATQAPAPAESAKPRPFTNEDVLKLHAAGFTEQEIVNAIEAASNKSFDTSADGLIALKAVKLSGRVIAAVLGKPYSPEPAPVNATPVVATTVPTAPTITPEAPDQKPASRGRKFPMFGLAGLVGGKKDSSTVDGKKLKDGEPAVIPTTLAPIAVTKTLKTFFESRNADYKIEGDRISTEWGHNRRCGIGNRCEDRAVVQVIDNNGAATVRVRVFQRKHEGGINKKPWVEDGDSKGDLTAQFAAELESVLAAATTTLQR